MTNTAPGASGPSWLETDRLSSLRDYEILDTGPDEALDSITRAAALICHAPMAAVTFIDGQRHWIKAGTGLNIQELPRETSFCAEAIRQQSGLLVIPDAALDQRFREKPFVKGEPYLRFYAGVVLKSDQGLPLGALSVLDHAPREQGLPEVQTEALRVLAQAVMSHLELGRISRLALKREKRLATIIDAIPQKLWTCRPDGSNDYFNRRWYEFTGAQPGETDGRRWLDFVHPDDRERVLAQRRLSFQTGQDYEIEYRLRHHSGEYLWVLARAHPRRNRWGRIDRWYGTATTIHRTKLAELSLFESEQRYRALIDTSADATWVADSVGLLAQGWGWEEMAESHPDSYLGQGWLAALHPEDRDRTIALWQHAQETSRTYEAELRIRRGQGQYRWVSVKAVPVRNSDGSIREWIGSTTDIHDRRQAAEELRASLGRLRLALRAGRMVGWELNTETGHLVCSVNSNDLLGIGSGPVTDFLAKIHPEDRAEIEALLASGTDLSDDAVELRFTLPSGNMGWLELRAEQVGPSHLVGILFDISERKRTEEEILWAAHHDALTRLLNRHAFAEAFEKEWRHVIRSGAPISVLFIDADYFKQYNDHYGHGAGDDLLRALAARLEAHIRRPRDCAARYGGEEFVVLLPETDEAGALQRAEVIREAVEAMAIAHAGSPLGIVTISIGIATMRPDQAAVRSDLLEAADAALYEAKAAGRNRVRVSATLSRTVTGGCYHGD